VVRYRIEVGRNQGALPKEIVGAIANEGGIEGKLIGQINLFDDYSTVELPSLPPEVLDILKRTRVRQLPLKIRVAEVGEGEVRRPPARPRSDKVREPFAESPRKSPWETQAPERRPASADFPAKPPYRGEKKPAGEWKGKGAGKPFGKPGTKPPEKKRPY
jgi:ATP-dependent RNA helicase DeaD